MKYLFLALTFIILISSGIIAQNVEVKITNIQSNKGKVILSVFKDEKSFKEEKPILKKVYSKDKLSEGNLFVKLNLEKGTYGICVMDDSNGNGEMEYNFIGLPKEGFGFSNFYLTGMSRPKFSEFNFQIAEGTKRIIAKMKYM